MFAKKLGFCVSGTGESKSRIRLDRTAFILISPMPEG